MMKTISYERLLIASIKGLARAHLFMSMNRGLRPRHQ